jgi:hypothetical protein
MIHGEMATQSRATFQNPIFFLPLSFIYFFEKKDLQQRRNFPFTSLLKAISR